MGYSYVDGTIITATSNVTAPAGRSVGDLLVVCGFLRGDTATDERATSGDPTGFTFLQLVDNGAFHGCIMWARLATGDSNDNISSYTNNWDGLGMLVFTGDVPDTLTGIQHDSATRAVTSTVMAIPSLTTTIDGCALVYISRNNKTATEDGVTTTGIPGSYTEVDEVVTNGSTSIASYGYEILATAGTESGGNFTTSVALPSDRSDGIAIAFAPAQFVQHYYTVYQDGQGASATDANVKAGTGTGAITSGSDTSVTTGSAKEFTATGLAPSTDYDLEYVVSDGTNDTRASTTNFRTKAQTGSVVINTPGPIVRN